jgi:hypothetical protein
MPKSTINLEELPEKLIKNAGEVFTKIATYIPSQTKKAGTFSCFL